MQQWLKGIAASLAAILALFWGGIGVIGNFQTIPPVLQWISSHSGWIILPCLLIFLLADRITKYFTPIEIILLGLGVSGSPLLRLRIVNKDTKEKRVESVTLEAVDASGNVSEPGVHSFVRCDGFKDGKTHLMPPGSSFEIQYRASSGSTAMFNASRPTAKQIKYFAAKVKLEDGTEIPSKKYHVIDDQKKIKDTELPYDSKSKGNTDTELDARDKIMVACADAIFAGKKMFWALLAVRADELSDNDDLVYICETLVSNGHENQLDIIPKGTWLYILKKARLSPNRPSNEVELYDFISELANLKPPSK